jgi:hypothetical protein
MSLGQRRSAAFATFLTIAFLTGCSDGTAVEDNPQDFTGNYTLVSFAQGSAALVTPVPGTTGTFTMTATNYQASIHLLVPVDTTIVDAGTYTASGSATTGTWGQQSTVVPTLQYAGTYVYDAATDRLTLDTTAQGIRTVLELQKN